MLPKLAVLAPMLPELAVLASVPPVPLHAVPAVPWHAVPAVTAMGDLVRALTVMACQLLSAVCGCSSCCSPS